MIIDNFGLHRIVSLDTYVAYTKSNLYFEYNTKKFDRNEYYSKELLERIKRK
jgi:hypothetical protein